MGPGAGSKELGAENNRRRDITISTLFAFHKNIRIPVSL
jgi:hypothetical protein